MEKGTLFSTPALNFFPHFATIMLCSINKELRDFAKRKGNIFWRNKLINDCHVYCDEPLATTGLDVDYFFYKYIKRLNVDFQHEFSRDGATSLFIQPSGTVARIVDRERKIRNLGYIPSQQNTKCVAVCQTPNHSLCLLNNGVVLDWGEFKLNDIITPPKDHKYIAVTGGERHFVALLDDGTIHARGNLYLSKSPKNRFKAITACDSYTVGLLHDGSIMAWGLQLFETLEMPLKDERCKIVAISAYLSHFCGLLEDGTVACWDITHDYFIGAYSPKVTKRILKCREKVVAINKNAFLLENGDIEFPFKQVFENVHEEQTKTSLVPNNSTYFQIGWFRQNTFFYNRKY